LVLFFLNYSITLKVYEFILAIEHGHSSLVKLLLEKGANINDKTDKGFTPLMIGMVIIKFSKIISNSNYCL
jgi:hypothetical protein